MKILIRPAIEILQVATSGRSDDDRDSNSALATDPGPLPTFPVITSHRLRIYSRGRIALFGAFDRSLVLSRISYPLARGWRSERGFIP